MGVGASTGSQPFAGAWPGDIVVAWILTIPAAGLVAAGAYAVLHPILG